jgi:hypothetical protein
MNLVDSDSTESNARGEACIEELRVIALKCAWKEGALMLV